MIGHQKGKQQTVDYVSFLIYVMLVLANEKKV